MLVGRSVVVVRTLRAGDLDRLYDLAADVRDLGDYWPLRLASELRWQKGLPENGWWEDGEGGLVITDHDGRIIGQVSVFKAPVYGHAYEIGYRIYKPEDWDKGCATEAAALVVAFIFEAKPVDRVQAAVHPGNEASRRVLEKCGFQFEGVMR